MKKQWITYVFNQFERIYGFTQWSEISYGGSDVSKVVINRSKTDFFRLQTPFPDAFISQEWLGKDIPFLFDTKQHYPIIEQKEGVVFINLDILAPSFYFLSGWQEFHSPHRDSIGRFPYAASIQKKLEIVAIPVVNYYFDILKKAIELAFGITLKVNLWNGKKTGVFLSHDIDKINSGWLEDSFSELKKGKLISAIQIASKKGTGTDVWFNFKHIVALEEQYNAISTFFFLPKKGLYKKVLNADYSILDKEVQQEMQFLYKKGWKIGLHGSYGTAFESQKLQKELGKFSNPISVNRFHFLSWEQRLTPLILEQTDIKIDCSLGFSEHYGYRNGICHPFNLFDLKQNKMLEIVEYPLHLMDTTFQQKKYLNVDKSQIVKVFVQLHAESEKFNGFTSVLWHNNFFSDYKYEGWKEIYEDILSTINTKETSFIVLN